MKVCKRNAIIGYFVGAASLPLTLSLGAYGCTETVVPAGINEGMSTESQPLFKEGTAWPGGTVPVCVNGNNPTLVAKAQQILTSVGWSAVTQVSFTGWVPCAAGGTKGAINLSFVASTNGSTTVPLGYPGTSGYEVVQIINDATDPHFTYEVLHEFGHALGFGHEQDRPDNFGPDGGAVICNQGIAPGGAQAGSYLTPYFDTQSIMNYCEDPGYNWQMSLSPGDVAGAQSVYGVTGPLAPMWNGQNSSNNAVARSPSNLDAFFARDDGTIWDTYWYAGLSGRWPTVAVTYPNAAPPSAPIAAVSRTQNNIDIFFAGTDSAIHQSYWNNGGAWNEITLPNTAGLVHAGEQVAALARAPGMLDLFFVGTDRNLYWMQYFPQNTTSFWGSPVAVVRDGSVPVGAAVTAVARTPDRMDVFFVGADNSLHNVFCYGTLGATSCTSRAWSYVTLATPTACLAPAGAGVAATARSANQLDVYYVNNAGSACTNWWTPTAGWNAYAFGNSIAKPGGQVSAISRTPSNLDIYFIDSLGELYTEWWYPGIGNWGTRAITAGGTGYFGNPVGATAKTSTSLDIFEAAASTSAPFYGNGLMTAYWYSNNPGVWNSYRP